MTPDIVNLFFSLIGVFIAALVANVFMLSLLVREHATEIKWIKRELNIGG